MMRPVSVLIDMINSEIPESEVELKTKFLNVKDEVGKIKNVRMFKQVCDILVDNFPEDPLNFNDWQITIFELVYNW